MARKGQTYHVGFLFATMAVLYYFEATPVAIIGITTLLYLGIVQDDGKHHAKELSKLIEGNEERLMNNAREEAAGINSALKNLGLEVETMAAQLRSIYVERCRY